MQWVVYNVCKGGSLLCCVWLDVYGVCFCEEGCFVVYSELFMVCVRVE